MTEYAKGFLSGTVDRVKEIDEEIKYWETRISEKPQYDCAVEFIGKISVLKTERVACVNYHQGFKDAMKIVETGRI